MQRRGHDPSAWLARLARRGGGSVVRHGLKSTLRGIWPRECMQLHRRLATLRGWCGQRDLTHRGRPRNCFAPGRPGSRHRLPGHLRQLRYLELHRRAVVSLLARSRACATGVVCHCVGWRRNYLRPDEPSLLARRVRVQRCTDTLPSSEEGKSCRADAGPTQCQTRDAPLPQRKQFQRTLDEADARRRLV
jgi:hypothetical protein